MSLAAMKSSAAKALAGKDTPHAMSPTGAVDTASRSAAARLGARAKPSARIRNFIEVSLKNQKAGDQRPLSST